MNKKGVSLITAVVIIIMAIAFNKVISASSDSKTTKVDTQKGLLVDVIYPKVENITNHYNGTGKLRAVDRFEIVAQVEGQLMPSARYFKEGNSYQQGELMLQIDQQEFYMSLMAQKSDFVSLTTSILPDLKSDYPASYPIWKNYVSSVNINNDLPELPKAKDQQEQFYLSGKGIFNKFYSVKSAEEKLKKYTIRAPFPGVVTAAKAEAGTAVRPGTALGTLINTQRYDLELTIPISHHKYIKEGTDAMLSSSEIEGQWHGKVIRIGGDIDEQSQSIKIFLRTNGTELKEGMYLNAKIELQPLADVIKLPRKMVDDQNRVFLIENNLLKQKTVNVISKQKDYAIIKGLEEGTPVLSTVVKSAYDGMPVRINR